MPAARPAGFPSSMGYLPRRLNNRTATVWPTAQHQLKAFFVDYERANEKLSVFQGLLPEVVGYWWIRSWADDFLFHTLEGINATVADVRALYQFGRELDRQFQLTDTPPEARHREDIEFTYHAKPLLRAGTRHPSAPYPPALDAHTPDAQPDHFPTPPAPAYAEGVPEPFARREDRPRNADGDWDEPSPWPELSPPPYKMRLYSGDFLDWAWFLATPDPLTPQQAEHLAHVRCSESGIDGGCEWRGTHGEQYGRLMKGVVTRLRDAVVTVSDSLRIGVQTIPPALSFADSLAPVSQWLERAEAVFVPPAVGDLFRFSPAFAPSSAVGAERSAPVMPAQIARDRPRWDAAARTLIVDGKTKAFRRNAKVVTKILDALERRSWPSVPIPHGLSQSPSDIRGMCKQCLGGVGIEIVPGGNELTVVWRRVAG